MLSSIWIEGGYTITTAIEHYRPGRPVGSYCRGSHGDAKFLRLAGFTAIGRRVTQFQPERAQRELNFLDEGHQ